MGRRRKKISDLPIPGFDRAVHRSFSTAFDLIVGTGYLIGRAISKEMSQYDCSAYSEVGQHHTPSYEYLIPKPKPKKSEFTVEIEELELAIKNKIATVKQCERLGSIYSMIGAHFEERYARIKALERYLMDNDLHGLYPKIVEAFNNPCKKPPQNISSDRDINIEYRRLLFKVELAKRKSYKH